MHCKQHNRTRLLKQFCILLTRRHCLCGKQVKVKRRGDDQKFIAEVLAIGIECDIALLTVKDETFWEGVNPLAFGPLPRLQVYCTDC